MAGHSVFRLIPYPILTYSRYLIFITFSRRRRMNNAIRQMEQYRQMELVGRGNFVDVYKAIDRQLKKHVLIKKSHSRLSQDDRSAFLKEGRMAMRLDHPHLLKVKALVEDHHPPYLVLDYSTHRLFRQRHPAGEVLPPTLIGRYTRQIAAALAYMHHAGLTHQHLRPENLVVSENGDILLADLSIMAFTRQSDAQEIHPPVNATLYMAPERSLGISNSVSDQYSLAVMTYEWFTGSPLPGEIILQHLTTSPSSQLRHAEQRPSTAKQALLKALASNPEERFDSITAFVAALGM
jgi:eukaryotic-like serine/threonine-protein kinase